MSTKRIANSLCNMCSVGCGLKVEVDQGRIVNASAMADHPFNTLCVKNRALLEWVYSKDRITSPLKKVNGGWEEISWNEAFGTIADRLTAIKEEQGPKALAVYAGYALVGTHTQELGKRFCDLYGTPNFATGASLCHLAKAMGHSLTFSESTIALSPSTRDARCVVMWGKNSPESALFEASGISSMRKAGARLIVIDPRRISLAKRADLYAQVRPGTDCAFALGLMNVIIADGLYDKSFVKDWTYGFEQLVDHVRDYSPERVEEITWVPAATTRDIARAYATTKPATIFQGVSLDHSCNGVQTSRAIAILVAITGNFDVSGGNAFWHPLKRASLGLKGRTRLEEAIGAAYPLFSKFSRQTTVVPLADAILTGQPHPVKAVIVQGANPLLTSPNANKLREAFRRLEFLVVVDLFMTETAKEADLVLPGASFLETKTLKAYHSRGAPLVAMSDRVVKPLGNCLEDWAIWSELAQRMGFGEHFPWKDNEEVIGSLLEPTDLSTDDLKASPGGVFYEPVGTRRYLKDGFATPSGKVEIYSQTMKEHGYAPLPTYDEPRESPVGSPELARKYPLILTAGARIAPFTHSQHRNIASLRKLAPNPLVEINPRTAGDLGIADGDLVAIDSPRGSIKSYARVTDDVPAQVISIQHGWSEANANALTDDMARDPISCYPGFRSSLCRVSKAIS